MCEQFHDSRASRVRLPVAIPLAISDSHDASGQEHPSGTTNAELVRSLEGFQSGIAEINGIHLRYVAGGTGTPLNLLPGWPETWWQYHKIMPSLALHFHVVSVDIRGMGLSSKPADGYDKKTMAKYSRVATNHARKGPIYAERNPDNLIIAKIVPG